MLGVSSLICKSDNLFYESLYSSEINSPTGGVAAAILFFFLNLNPHQGKSLRQHTEEFDFVGLFFIVGGVVLLLLGFNESETSCKSSIKPKRLHGTYTTSGSSKQTIICLVLGVAALLVGGVNETLTKRSPIIPPRVFYVGFCVLNFINTCSPWIQTRTTAILLIVTFLHALAFFSGAYYLPLYFQVLGASATRSGVESVVS